MKAVALSSEPAAFASLHCPLAAAGIDLLRTELPHQFFRNLHRFNAALVLVHWPLRDVAAQSVIARIRTLFQSAAPIVAVSAHDSANDAVAALQAGADEFVSVDAPGDVLRARLGAVLRRYGGSAAAASLVVHEGPYRVDYAAQEVIVQGAAVALTPKEFDLFWVLLSNLDRLIPKVELMTCVWGQHVELDSHTLPQHMHALRRKLRFDAFGFRLAPVYGAGYRLESSLARARARPSEPIRERPLAAVASR